MESVLVVLDSCVGLLRIPIYFVVSCPAFLYPSEYPAIIILRWVSYTKYYLDVAFVFLKHMYPFLSSHKYIYGTSTTNKFGSWRDSTPEPVCQAIMRPNQTKYCFIRIQRAAFFVR